ncbi:unnamed protein product [Strongylus vulgaris]|uniref:DM domain-containing protein n=1 Tax=Strongylus vulgaris TaxID=40348 RepID=A0A3P7K9F2_STRVU|nr:unnamed protein product [Strongylus vulgaris]
MSSFQLAESPRETVNGRRVRDPQCARCRQHGFRVPLRGHKRVLCQFASCKCEMVSSAGIVIPVAVFPILHDKKSSKLYFVQWIDRS